MIKNIMFQMAIKLITLLLFLSLFSCNNQVEHVELEVLVRDTVKVEEKVLVRVYSKNIDWKIIKAYFDCQDKLEPNKIDLLNETIEGCNKELFVKDDTILIQFTPAKSGYQEFGKIKALMKKGTHEYKVLESGFSYVVVPREGSELSMYDLFPR